MNDDEYKRPMTMREVMEDEHPVDYEQQREDYYERKMAHREEVLVPLAWLSVGVFLAWVAWQIYNVAMMWWHA